MPYDKPIFEKEVVQSQFVVSHSGLLHKNEKGKNTNRCVNLILAFRIVVQIYLWWLNYINMNTEQPSGNIMFSHLSFDMK